jgi:hypothetical protein
MSWCRRSSRSCWVPAIAPSRSCSLRPDISAGSVPGLRAAYGTLGSNVLALMRAPVACGWFGIQARSAEGWHVLHEPRAGWPTLLGAGFGGHTTTEWLSFLPF